MAVALRLRREGTKDRPYYRVVAADNRARRDGRYIEIVGSYDPMKEKDNSEIDLEKSINGSPMVPSLATPSAASSKGSQKRRGVDPKIFVNACSLMGQAVFFCAPPPKVPWVAHGLGSRSTRIPRIRA